MTEFSKESPLNTDPALYKWIGFISWNNSCDSIDFRTKTLNEMQIIMRSFMSVNSKRKYEISVSINDMIFCPNIPDTFESIDHTIKLMNNINNWE